MEFTEQMLDAIEAVKGRRDPKYWDNQCKRYMEKQQATKKREADAKEESNPKRARQLLSFLLLPFCCSVWFAVCRAQVASCGMI